MSLFSRPVRAALLAASLCLAAPAASNAQDDFGAVPGEESGEGKPIFGYLACGAGCIAIMFVICLSARR